MAMNKYGGVNDMPNGYTKTEHGKRIYMLWFDMLRRCYDEKQLARKRGKSYADVIVCDRWLYLRNFAEDIAKLDGYDKWLLGNSMALDKDISVQVATKVYSPTTCKFVTVKENMREMNDRCKTIETAREFVKAKYVLFRDDEYHVFDMEKDACEFLGVKQCSVAGAWRDKGKCKGWNVIRIGNGADMRGERNEYEDAEQRWIPVSERLPEDYTDVLVWFEYFRYGDYNCLYQTYGIGDYIANYGWMINHETGWHKLRVIAWMPLPEPYKGETDE